MAVTVCLLVATAAVDPLLSRSFSFALVKYHTQSEGLIGGQVQLTATGSGLVPASTLAGWLDPRVTVVTGSPTRSTSALASWADPDWLVSLQHTEDACAHVHVVSGRCPRARDEVMVSVATQHQAEARKVSLRAPIRLKMASTKNGFVIYDTGHTVRVVGTFTASSTSVFWGGVNPARFSKNPTPGAPNATLLTSSATFSGQVPAEGSRSGPAKRWSQVSTSVVYPISLPKLSPRTLPAAVDGIHATSARHGGIQLYEPLSQIDDQTHNDLSQVRVIVPFLLVQLGIVLLILLVQVVTYLATVRRGEAVVLKMRGNGAAGVLRLGAGEFAPAVAAGSFAGLALAYAVDEVARRAWLPGSVVAQWVWGSLATAVGAVALIGVVWLVSWWLMASESINSLLRSRPPRRRARLSMPAAVLGTLCLLGIVLTATKNLTGAPTQVTPVLLAGLVAIVVGMLLAPVAARLVRWLLARCRPAGALAVAQLGRRAGVVAAVATLIITSALLTLSVSVFARAADNRAARTVADLGAAALVHVHTGSGSPNGQNLIDAVTAVDPQHRQFTPAVLISAVSPTSGAVLGVIPSDMQRIGSRAGLRHSVPWSALATGSSNGKPAALISTWTTKGAVGSLVSAPTMADVDGDFTVVGAAPYIPGVGARTIVVDLRTMLQAGERQDNVYFQVFSATQDPGRLARLEKALQKAGFASTDVETERQVRAGYDATATAWATNLSIVVSALSVLAALVSVVLVAIASRADRERDLRALRAGGLSRRVLRAATVGEFVLLALLGSVIGAATAPFAAWLTGRTMLWWSTPPAQPVTQTGFQWSAGSTSALALILLLLIVATLFGVRLAKSAATSEKDRAA